MSRVSGSVAEGLSVYRLGIVGPPTFQRCCMSYSAVWTIYRKFCIEFTKVYTVGYDLARCSWMRRISVASWFPATLNGTMKTSLAAFAEHLPYHTTLGRDREYQNELYEWDSFCRFPAARSSTAKEGSLRERRRLAVPKISWFALCLKANKAVTMWWHLYEGTLFTEVRGQAGGT